MATPPVLHPSLRQPHITPLDDPLYIVCAVENAEGFATRYRHYRAFEKHATDSGAIVYTVEAVNGQRNFEVTQATNPRHVQLRAKTDLWRKENLQNIGIARLPHDWKYVALCDADFLNTRTDWVQATKQALQRWAAVQMFSTYSYLSAGNAVESINKGFIYALSNGPTCHDGHYGPRGAPGGMWAYTKATIEAIRGMLQTPILGSSDWYMAYALAGVADEHRDSQLAACSEGYRKSVEEWCNLASAAIRSNVGYVENHAVHYYHGAINKRGYEWRWKILRTHQFDPTTDLVTEHSGLLELAGNKPGMQKEIRDYFHSRNEDAV